MLANTTATATSMMDKAHLTACPEEQQQQRKIMTMEGLVAALNEEFEEERKRNENMVVGKADKVERIRKIMESYCGSDFERYVFYDENMYTRNLVWKTSDYVLILLCWSAGTKSGIHDHSKSNCWARVIKGDLDEVLFKYNAECVGQPLVPYAKARCSPGNVMYINDAIGLHRVENPSADSPAISLHLYSPPFEVCGCFCPLTGVERRGKMCFFSEYGVKVDYSALMNNNNATTTTTTNNCNGGATATNSTNNSNSNNVPCLDSTPQPCCE
eukprot:GEZU01005184.1.p1 GENE.GEZU01005184.1~~GEZU01005184.1.p1  ORF type:complete len:271 (-),score=52.01 GEZU01005184.1:200-1012(-)